MTPSLKPDVCIFGDKLGVSMGSSYEYIDLSYARSLIRQLQSKAAQLSRQQQRKARAARKAGAA